MKDKLPLLLLPGSLCDEELFTPQLMYFSSMRPVFVGDYTGAQSIESMADKILARAPKKFALAGLSMGGIVCFEIMRQAPERVEQLALLDTNFRGELPEKLEMRLEQIQAVRSGGLAGLLSLIEGFFFPLYVAPSNRNDAALKSTVLRMAISAGVGEFERQWHALMTRPDSTRTLPKIQCPTLVLCGDQDAMCSPDVHREMADQIDRASLQYIKNCGHLSTLESPLLVNRALGGWLAV